MVETILFLNEVIPQSRFFYDQFRYFSLLIGYLRKLHVLLLELLIVLLYLR